MPPLECQFIERQFDLSYAPSDEDEDNEEWPELRWSYFPELGDDYEEVSNGEGLYRKKLCHAEANGSRMVAPEDLRDVLLPYGNGTSWKVYGPPCNEGNEFHFRFCKSGGASNTYVLDRDWPYFCRTYRLLPNDVCIFRITSARGVHGPDRPKTRPGPDEI
ncbi:hypothetical protein PIB30_003906 [Stylosanthes scabra]|uniref:TF-B3 domain-containing protein n=1 Tax=Stylosanthes scabra TaxID=79078 RepID=A0ABU6U3R4_9FABA|nr:hypothetical protein [Stylosanthes scabra]